LLTAEAEAFFEVETSLHVGAAATLQAGAGTLLAGSLLAGTLLAGAVLLSARALLAAGALSSMETALARAEAEMTEALPDTGVGALI